MRAVETSVYEVERVAVALHRETPWVYGQDDGEDITKPWAGAPESVRDTYRAEARAAIGAVDAARGTKPAGVPADFSKVHIVWAIGTANQAWSGVPQFVAAAGDAYARQHPTQFAAEQEAMQQQFVQQQGSARFVTTIETLPTPPMEASE